MHLADHIRPLLRDHDCVIIPDFGGLVADAAPARLQPGRQVFSPPTKLVAFNQALTRNDGLLVDALAQHRGLSIAQAREAVRQAVAQLQQDLQETNRTELPGIGIFRRAAGRGLSFEYTGSDNLLPASYGLPEVVARPVQTTSTRLVREKSAQPALRSGHAQRSRLARLMPGAAIVVVAALLISAYSQLAFQPGSLLVEKWKTGIASLTAPKPAAPAPAVVTSAELEAPQQATLAQQAWSDEGEATNLSAPAELPATSSALPEPTATERTSPDALTSEPVADTAPAAVEEAPAKPLVANAEKADEKVVEAAKAPVAKAPAASVSATTIKSRTGRFYVIAGAFSSLASAEKVRKAHKSGTARVILPPRGSRLYRLSVADFADKASADREARRLRTKAHSTNSHLVLNY